ncbi:MAG: thioesterase family protein [Cellvibrionales bacterium]|jgi:acyl-CoA thioester hydrolase|nr:thioesterase family protein [Cellvibrionales bacterium]
MYLPDISLPEKMAFSTNIHIYINDLVGGLHVGNHTLVSYLNEAQMRFLTALGFPTLIVDNAITFNNEIAVQYQREARYGDVLTVQAHIDPLEDRQYRIAYRIQNQHGKTVLTAQMGMVFVDQATGRRCDVPGAFRDAWGQFTGT